MENALATLRTWIARTNDVSDKYFVKVPGQYRPLSDFPIQTNSSTGATLDRQSD
jgi:hypothetical protein